MDFLNGALAFIIVLAVSIVWMCLTFRGLLFALENVFDHKSEVGPALIFGTLLGAIAMACVMCGWYFKTHMNGDGSLLVIAGCIVGLVISMSFVSALWTTITAIKLLVVWLKNRHAPSLTLV